MPELINPAGSPEANRALPDSQRRVFLKTSGAVAMTAALAPSVAMAGGSAAKPVANESNPAPSARFDLPAGYNILFVLVDQERYFDAWPMSVPGRERLARSGISFINHQIAACVCSPSRSTIYTGQHMQRTGVFDNAGLPWQPDMPTSIRTVGHMMKDAGYQAVYVGKWHLSATMHESNSPYNAPVADYNKAMRAYGFDDYFGVGDLVGSAHGGYNFDGVTTQAAISWMREQRRNAAGAKPWMLAVNLVNPHDVMWLNTDPSGRPNGSGLIPTRPAPDTQLYGAHWDKVPLPVSRRQPLAAPDRPKAHAMYSAAHEALIGKIEFDDATVKRYQDYYLNCIRDCDRHVERLLDELDDLGIADKTIVVLTSDHGDLAGHHQMIDKGANAYRQQNHVPMIVRHPAFRGGKSCRALTSHLDVAPTLVALTGAPADKVASVVGPDAKGSSFAHLLAQPERASVHAIRDAALFNYAMLLYYDSEWMLAEFRTMRDRGVPPDEMHRRAAALQPDLAQRGAIRSVFDGRYRFSRYFALSNFNEPDTLADLTAANDLELFDLHTDPDEMHNLAMRPDLHGALMVEMNAKLNRLIREEVGQDDLSSLPFKDGRLQFQFRAHA
ncbi:arylsulfatase [Burkholderia cepacia]|uniref:Choline-sulfatase n=1 Tax=Burkholderia lata (strain ATCC 17760 / DSM 23089 / LMG 22485 / NCIMB 9086 / R18194 / 383) TaxID=482957 RepID=A0A833PNE5_BURL3|nr:sulfatase-like hydrolase/transferase [Burkholderia lata]KAF1033596.1 MAG: Choline-sulfatase [Burkholderia lata]KER72958.1 arylsulfatase [Burkholderia cepacia]